MSIQVLLFDTNHNLQFGGYCKLQINQIAAILNVIPVVEGEFKPIFALFKWDFVKNKNALFIFAEQNFMDFALFFDDESVCANFYDIICQIKEATSNIGHEIVQNRFLHPICQRIVLNDPTSLAVMNIILNWLDEFEDNQREKLSNLLKEICFTISQEVHDFHGSALPYAERQLIKFTEINEKNRLKIADLRRQNEILEKELKKEKRNNAQNEIKIDELINQVTDLRKQIDEIRAVENVAATNNNQSSEDTVQLFPPNKTNDETGYSLNPPENEELPENLKTDKHEYKFLKKLGEGVDTLVYEVINEKEELYACKLTNLGERVFNDIQIMRLSESIESSHFCKVEQAGITGDSYYCIFELLGPKLSKIVKEASETKLLILCKQSLEAIQDMHRLGFLHRDIKDDNLAVGRSGTAKAQTVVIFDFGASETVKEDKIGYEQLIEKESDIYLKKHDLIQWLCMCLKWFNCYLENEYQSNEKKIRLEGCPEMIMKNFKIIAQLNENLKGFRYIYSFITTLKPGHLPDYSYILTTIDLMLEMSAENLFWMPGIIYDPPHSSLKDPIESIYDKYRPPFYAKSRKYKSTQNHVVEYYGTHLNLRDNGPIESDRGPKTVEVFECRPNQSKRCSMWIAVYNYDKKKIQPGDQVEIYKVSNYHNCKLKGKDQSKKPPIQYPQKDNFVDLSVFFDN